MVGEPHGRAHDAVSTMTLDVRLFGGVELSDTPPEAYLERRLVAVLAARRNQQPINASDLIDVVWNSRPPKAAESSLYSKVSRVRSLLSGDVSIDRARRGYVLTVDPDRCDLDIFEKRAQAFIQGGLTAPLELAEAALDLWRGVPFGEFADEHFVKAEVTRLHGVRDSVEYHLIEVLLSRRRFAEALVTSEALQVRQPFGEQVCGARMRALAGLGRHTEALRVLHEFRSHLRRETGLDPHSELIALEQAMLGADQTTAVEPSPRRGRRMAPGRLYGREAALAEVRGRLSTARLVTIIGEGGLGKSRLATEAAAQFDSVIWCDVEAARSVDEMIEVLCRAAGTPSPGVAQPKLFDTLDLAEESVVVFDGCEAAIEAAASVVTELLARSSVRVLATSRTALHASGEYLYRLAPLRGDDATSPAVAMLAERAQAAGATLSVNDEELVAISRRLDGHPLSIELIAPRLAVLPASEVLASLDGDPGWSQTLVSAGLGRTLDGAVGVTYHGLAPRLQRLFRAVSVFEAGVGIDAFRRLARLVDPTGDPMHDLVVLAEHSLLRVEVDSHGLRRYRMLTPIADVGRCLAEVAGELVEFRRLQAQTMVQLISAARDEGFGAREAYWADVVTSESANLRAAYRSGQLYGWFDVQVPLVAGLLTEAVLRERVEYQEWAVDLAGRDEIPTSNRAAEVLALAGHTLMLRGDFTAAIHMSKRAARAVVDGARPTWLIDSDLFLHSVMSSFGIVDDRARRHLQLLQAYTTTTGDPMGAALAAFNLAFVSADTGRLDVSIGAALSCVRLGRRYESTTIKAMGQFSMARARVVANPERALEQIEAARELAAMARCSLVEAHSTRTMWSATASNDVVPLLRSLARVVTDMPLERLLQEITGLLIPLTRAGHLEVAAQICGSLSRTLWRETAGARAAESRLRELLGHEVFLHAFRRGRRLSAAGLVETVLEILDDGGPALDTS